MGVSRDNTCGHRGDWWWCGVVQGKVEAKKIAYMKLVGGEQRQGGKRANKERYKATKKEAKLAVPTTKMVAFERWYEELCERMG